MSLKERVYSVLIVSATKTFTSVLFSLLPEKKYSPIKVVSSVSAAKRIILEREFDFVIINSPLPDDAGIRFAVDVCTQKGRVVLLMVKRELYEETYDKTSIHGVFTLPKPTSEETMSQALSWMASVRERLRRVEKKTVSIEEKMEEIRLVNRAKWLLIDNLKMTEPDAHRYIEKQAMDRCISRGELAKEIIKTY